MLDKNNSVSSFIGKDILEINNGTIIKNIANSEKENLTFTHKETMELTLLLTVSQ